MSTSRSETPAETLSPADLLAARYGADEAPAKLILNDTIAALLSHRTVRAYSDRPLPDGLVETLVAAAQSAPSSSNLQTFSVISVQNPETRAALSEVTGGQKHVIAAPLMLVWLADLSRLEALGRRNDTPTTGLDFLESYVVAVIDAALAAQNAVVALESLGLGCVYIGALRNKPQEVARLLGLPPNVMGVFGMCIGYPDPERPADVKPRLSQKLVLHKERYDASLPQEPIDHYEATMKGFQHGQGMAEVGWVSTALARVKAPESLTGRDQLGAVLKSLGFPLR
ncbi:NADPH-dependent oxidoreductase [Xanthobacter variabilis]|uniref:NADPH-dependent oxidoreductase n=1 Tax=Xanthobacter variabilis TaxID=3119932 RepID=UPI00372C1A76